MISSTISINNGIFNIFLCCGDITTATCGDCVANASKEILHKCPIEKDSTNAQKRKTPSFGMMSDAALLEPIHFLRQARITILHIDEHGQHFTQLLKDTTDELAEREASDGFGKRFAVKDADIMSSNRLYTLAQCTPDLTAVDCKSCLQVAIDNLPSDKEGGRVLAPSCNVRFELDKFYNETVFHEAPAPALAPPPAAVVAAAPPSSTVRSKGAKELCFLVNFAFFVLLG